MSDGAPLLWVLIGPNGAGKSTFYERRVRPVLAAPFVNADAIAAERWPDDPLAHSVEAARLAEEAREHQLVARRSFVTETVFSHPSRLDLLRRARLLGFQVWVTFVGVESADLAVVRVSQRAARGGHPIPIEKIRARFERLVPLAVEAVTTADRGLVVDNTSYARPLHRVLAFERGTLVHVADEVPPWTRHAFAERLEH